MIRIRNLKLEYPGRFNLSINELSVEKGKILSIIGPNGAGKTTLLNLIGMFENLKGGSIKVLGQEIASGNKDKLYLRRRISFVFSRPFLLNRPVWENVSLPLALRGKNDGKRVDEILRLFGVSALKEQNAFTLSQGQAHRVSLARALVSEPELILLDEPFLSLDSLCKEKLMQDLRRIIKEKKITAIFVTQDQFEAMRMADTMAVMFEGRILQQAGPEDIFTRPASKQVADFVGVETVIEGSVIDKKENLCFVKIRDRVLEAVSDCVIGDEVFFCLRPEDITLAKKLEDTSARNHFKAKIARIEPWKLGYEVVLSAGFNLAASVTRQSLEDLSLKTGDEIFVLFKATAAHLIKR